MHPKISSLTTLLSILCVLAFLTPTIKGQEPEKEPKYKPRYLLRAFTATGADSNDYDINDYNVDNDHAVIYIRNLKNKNKLWEAEVGFTKPMEFELRIAPDKKHAVLFSSYGVRGQDLSWIHLAGGNPPARDIDLEEFEKLALKACGNVGLVSLDVHSYHFTLCFLDWDAQSRCRLKWQCTFKHQDDNYHTNTGIAIVTAGRNGGPSLGLDSFLTDVEDMAKVRYGKHVTLKK